MNHDYEYTPSNGFTKWLDKRLPLVRFADENMLSFPTPKNLNYFWTFGFILTLCLVTQIITGIVLAMHYTPHVLMAFDSIEHIMRDVNYGWLIRYIHANGASMFFLAIFIHMFRGLYYGSYKGPLRWWCQVPNGWYFQRSGQSPICPWPRRRSTVVGPQPACL